MADWTFRGVTNVRRKHLLTWIGFIVLLPGAALFIGPTVWMFFSSFQTNAQIVSFPPTLLPHPWTLEGFGKGLTELPFGRYFWNTSVVAVLSSLGGVVSSSLVGFAFAKLRARFKNILFLCVLSGLMVPYAVVMIPQYQLYKYLGWIDTYYPLIVPAWLGLPFLIFLFRQFFATIPNDVFEAARIDGCGYLRLYAKIGLPLSGPAIATAFIFHFEAAWNDFLAPLIYLNSNMKYTLSLGLAAFQNAYSGTPWNELMAVSLVVASVPIIVFFVAQKYVLKGITLTVK